MDDDDLLDFLLDDLFFDEDLEDVPLLPSLLRLLLRRFVLLFVLLLLPPRRRLREP